MTTHIQITVGPEAFRFNSFWQWRNKASSWFGQNGLRHGDSICISSAGRVCQCGKDFEAARDNKEFPVVVYRRG